MSASAARALAPYGLLHAWHRWRRQLAARRADLGAPPERLVLILCNPRSGSTWLVDALRCHPAIELHPRYTVFALLGCVGRRYPLDLASGASDAAQVEVELGRWSGVPPFACEGAEAEPAVRALPYAIEKIHPHFFGHDEGAFLARLAALERRAQVETVYLTREPQAALRSFLSYQRRNPRWNAQIRPPQAPRHLRRMYETLLRTARRRPGLVVDYDDLAQRFAPTLALMLARLWPHAPPPSAGAWGWGPRALRNDRMDVHELSSRYLQSTRRITVLAPRRRPRAGARCRGSAARASPSGCGRCR